MENSQSYAAGRAGGRTGEEEVSDCEKQVQVWNVRVEVNLGFSGEWSKEELLETVGTAIEGIDGWEVVDAALAAQPTNKAPVELCEQCCDEDCECSCHNKKEAGK